MINTGTYSFFNKIHKGATHSSIGITYSSLDAYLDNKRKNNPSFGLSSSHHMNFHGTHSRWGTTQSHPFASVIYRQSKFFIKTNEKTKHYPATDLSNFVIEITGLTTSRVDNIIIGANVTVNGSLVTDTNYQLSVGQIVRVGDGHFNNNSKNIAIVGTASS